MNDIVIVVTGAAPLPSVAVDALPDGAIVLAADGALDHALAAGLTPAALVGDLDSISAAGLDWAEANASIQRHPPDKEHTDTELALLTAADLNPARAHPGLGRWRSTRPHVRRDRRPRWPAPSPASRRSRGGGANGASWCCTVRAGPG